MKNTEKCLRAVKEIEDIAYSSDGDVSVSSRLSALKMLVELYGELYPNDSTDEKLDVIIAGLKAIACSNIPKN